MKNDRVTRETVRNCNAFIAFCFESTVGISSGVLTPEEVSEQYQLFLRGIYSSSPERSRSAFEETVNRCMSTNGGYYDVKIPSLQVPRK